MNRLRVIFACLLMLLLPLQGFAAASLVFCRGHHEHDEVRLAARGASAATGHHAGHEHRHGAATDPCGRCASCCHGVAIAEAPAAPLLGALATTVNVERAVHVRHEPLPLPERPPRA